MIDWKTRVKNKTFWVTFIPTLLILIQVALVPFGYKFEIEPLNTELLNIVNAAFALLMVLGVINDPTIRGISDKKGATK